MTERDFVNRGSTTEPITEQLGQTVSDVKQQAGEKVEQLTDQAKQSVTAQLSTQKQKASETLGSVAQALRQTSHQMRSGDQAAIGDYATKAADQVERLSGFLRDRDVNDILHETEQFARRQPALFLGGAFVLGLIGARFLKSSSQNTQRANSNPAPYDRNRYPTSPVYQQNRSIAGRGYGPNSNPANVQQSRSAMNSRGQMNSGGQRGINASGMNTAAGSATTQASNQDNQRFGSVGDQENR